MPTTRARRKNSVQVQYAVPRRGVPSAASFRKWAALSPSAITIRIVGASEGRRLNKAYRKRNYPTNVLAFPYGRGKGDLVLCHPVVAREARAQGKHIAAHYAHLVLHGLLHLHGYDHEKKREAERMERAEIRLLRRAGYPNPYTVE